MADEKSYLKIDLNPELIQSRKLKQIRITPETLAGFLKADDHSFHVQSSIPATAQLVRVWMDGYMIGEIVLVFYDESFAIIEEYKLIPEFEPNSVLFITIYEKESQT